MARNRSGKRTGTVDYLRDDYLYNAGAGNRTKAAAGMVEVIFYDKQVTASRISSQIPRGFRIATDAEVTKNLERSQKLRDRAAEYGLHGIWASDGSGEKVRIALCNDMDYVMETGRIIGAVALVKLGKKELNATRLGRR